MDTKGTVWKEELGWGVNVAVFDGAKLHETFTSYDHKRMKDAVLRGNRFLEAMGIEMKEPWEKV